MRKRFNGNSNIILHPYSLVEMLVVIAIIAILIGLGSGGYTVAHKWLAQSSTEALLSKLKIALESYKNDKGYYPYSTNTPENFRLDTNAKDYANNGSVPDPNNHLQPRNNMNNFVDYSKIQQDQSFKHNSGSCNYYYVKDGWNAPLKSKITLMDGTQTDVFGAIKYECPGTINKTSFDIYSAGNDRVFGVNAATGKNDDVYVKF